MTIISKNQEGFTLPEMAVALFGFSLIIVGLVALFSNIFSISFRQGTLLEGSDQARKLAFGIVGELRNAETSSTGSYSLGAAGENEIIFYSNIDADSEIERLRYFASGGKLYRGVINPSGSPLAYNLSNESVSTALNGLANGSTTPVFYFYDGDYDGISGTPLTAPINLTRVKFVSVQLQIKNEAGVENQNFYTVTASGAIRNLKENLGE
ncbi:MAG: hypothetical protein COT92_03265 [Candidatus Doudnabacteria bacterium CG10_big_fil_rev_8_21_14_0_10_42_18]|uniref:Prepilin-type N-terminal cleavage/methylation domain-containing protein n=1 Tax=Candidatus Doudnabacteria bacterium CG10_big_fil_rev_8_21_14_0_10_42_18 TaxID=1974552 RepID=A0A2H0VCK9_9BACT|nr:MAG: hypothetical protein COT92_03265 [Candidatus Doudnabacteria bacterium CG10_big_fil_rev_8_21_14_0_10_42_18]